MSKFCPVYFYVLLQEVTRENKFFGGWNHYMAEAQRKSSCCVFRLYRVIPTGWWSGYYCFSVAGMCLMEGCSFLCCYVLSFITIKQFLCNSITKISQLLFHTHIGTSVWCLEGAKTVLKSHFSHLFFYPAYLVTPKTQILRMTWNFEVRYFPMVQNLKTIKLDKI